MLIIGDKEGFEIPVHSMIKESTMNRLSAIVVKILSALCSAQLMSGKMIAFIRETFAIKFPQAFAMVVIVPDDPMYLRAPP